MKKISVMEGVNYYVRNKETGKLNIVTTKEFYQSLEFPQRKIFSKYCLFSKKQGCWISKAKTSNAGHLMRELVKLGFEDRGETGEELSFSDQVERQQERAAIRAERSEARAQKAQEHSDSLYKTASEMASIIPFGQPILVGHHSEHRDRKYRERIHNTMGRSVKEQEKVGYYEDKSANAKYEASGEKFKDPRYLANRMKETMASIRRLERALKGKLYVHSPEREISEEDRKFYTEQLLKEQDKMDFYYNCMKEINPEYEFKKSASKSKQQNKGLK